METPEIVVVAAPASPPSEAVVAVAAETVVAAAETAVALAEGQAALAQTEAAIAVVNSAHAAEVAAEAAQEVVRDSEWRNSEIHRLWEETNSLRTLILELTTKLEPLIQAPLSAPETVILAEQVLVTPETTELSTPNGTSEEIASTPTELIAENVSAEVAAPVAPARRARRWI